MYYLFCNEFSSPVLGSYQCVTCQEKHITVKKEPPESLGMTVAGVRGSKSGELPIFVTSVPAHGCLARDGRIKRGKIGRAGNSETLPSSPCMQLMFEKSNKYSPNFLLNMIF